MRPRDRSLPVLLLLTLVGLWAALPTRVEAQRLPPAGGPVAPAERPQILVGAVAGYQGGLAVHLLGTVRRVAPGFPVDLRFRLGRTSVEPGDPAMARRVFINNATNGTPTESGRTLDLGLDAILERSDRTSWYVGVRRTSFKANFKYIGGNEDFDVTSTHWGMAAGVDLSYPVARKLTLLVSAGAEYHPATRLTGHDTSYSPDGDDVNPREDYTFDDADEAVKQPGLRPGLLLGVSWALGSSGRH